MPIRLFQRKLSDRPGDVAHAFLRAVSPFLATCLVGALALLPAVGMPATMPAQHAESVRHVAFDPDICDSIVNLPPGTAHES